MEPCCGVPAWRARRWHPRAQTNNATVQRGDQCNNVLQPGRVLGWDIPLRARLLCQSALGGVATAFQSSSAVCLADCRSE